MNGAYIFQISGVCLEKGPREPLLILPWLTIQYSPLRVSTACKVGAGMSDDGMMYSDHRPVFVDFSI